MYDGVPGFKEPHVDFKDRAPAFEMLFDLQADPTEHTNLATVPANARILTELRQKTAAQAIAINQRREAFMKTHAVQPRAVTAKAPKKRNRE
jgi:hypothetical protein